MERLPPELLHEIYSTACIDNGQTGRALSSVSRRIRETLGAHKYHSLAVSGLHQMKRLAATLKSFQTTHVPILNLCIGCDDVLTHIEREKIRNMKDPMILPRIIRQNMTEQQFSDMKARYLKDVGAYEDYVAKAETSFMAALLEVLQLCKDTLRTLSITVNLSSELPCFAAPSLISLTITCHLPVDFFDPNDRGIYPFPLLRRFHLGKNSSNTTLLPKCSRASPYLTHLRVRQSFALPSLVAQLLGHYVNGDHGEMGFEPLQCLQHLVVDMSPVKDKTQAIVLDHIAKSVRRIILLDNEARGRILLTDIPTVGVAEKEWLAGITGEELW